MILEWFEARAWQLSAAALLAFNLVVGGALVVEKVRSHRLEAANAALTAEINDPVKGLGPQLGRCQVNREKLQTTLDTQTAAITAKSALDAQKLAAAEKALSASQHLVEQLQTHADSTLAYKPAGADVCARMEDIRRHYLETMK